MIPSVRGYTIFIYVFSLDSIWWFGLSMFLDSETRADYADYARSHLGCEVIYSAGMVL